MIHISQNYTKYLFIPLLGLLVSYLLVPAVMAFAVKIGMVDKPDERRIHKGIIPRGGGLAVFVGFHLACAAIYFLPWHPFTITLSSNWWLKFLPASLFLVFVGVADDRWGMQPRIKLGCQILAAVALYASGVHLGSLFYFPLPWPVDCLLTVLWCVGFMNAFNLIDGLDGLATGLGIIAAAGVAGSMVIRHMPGDTLVLLGLIGACLGFLRYNFNPARVFLGDTGSMFIGFTLAAISLSTGSKGTIVASMAVPLLAAGVPILDTALAIWRRSVRRLRQNMEGNTNGNGKVFTADKDHLHHRLLRTGKSHKKVAITLYAINGGLVAVGLLTLAFHSHATAIYLVAFVVASYVIVRHLAHVELWDSGMAVLQGLRRPPSKAVAVMIYPLADLAIMGAALVPALYLPHIDPHDLKLVWLDHAVVWLAVPFLFIAFSGTYRRVWSKARLSEYIILIVAFTSGVLVATAASVGITSHLSRLAVIEALLFWLFSLVGLVGLRLFPRMIQDFLPIIIRHQAIEGVERVACLVYGAGYSCTLFLKAKASNTANQTSHRIVVCLLDDDANLHGRTVYGHRVLGGIDKLKGAILKYGVQEIVITAFLDESILRELEACAVTHDVRIFRWRTDIRSQQVSDLHFSFDRTLGKMTSHLLAATPETVHNAIGCCLELSAKLAGADASCVVLFEPGKETIIQTYRWPIRDSRLLLDAAGSLEAKSFPYVLRQLKVKKSIAIPEVSGMPPVAREEQVFLDAQGVKSAVVVPLGRSGKPIGFMGHYGVHSHVIWEKSAVDLLQIQADVLSLALMRLATPLPSDQVPSRAGELVEQHV
jgi:UDP-N-acetylmuramyl pentapeptide phosphotransferase/UDP-N-acetylglucosamine-1-phosphate transferase